MESAGIVRMCCNIANGRMEGGWLLKSKSIYFVSNEGWFPEQGQNPLKIIIKKLNFPTKMIPGF
jgi:hypothetical protein